MGRGGSTLNAKPHSLPCIRNPALLPPTPPPARPEPHPKGCGQDACSKAVVVGSLVSELESLSEDQRLPAAVRSEGRRKRRARSLARALLPAPEGGGEEGLLPPPLPSLVPREAAEMHGENWHLTVSAPGHCPVSCHSARRKEDGLDPERAPRARCL